MSDECGNSLGWAQSPDEVTIGKIEKLLRCVYVSPNESWLIPKVDIKSVGGKSIKILLQNFEWKQAVSLLKVWRMPFVWVHILPLFIKGSIESYSLHLPPPVIVSDPKIQSVICSFVFFIVFSLYESRSICILDSFVSLHAKLAAIPLAWFWYFINSRIAVGNRMGHQNAGGKAKSASCFCSQHLSH